MIISKNKYYGEGIRTVIISSLVFLSSISVFFLPMEIGNLKSGIIVALFFISIALIGLYGIYKGLGTIKSTRPINGFIGEPHLIVSQITDQKISRLKFLWAALFNPQAMQLSTLYSIWIFCLFLILFFSVDKTTSIAYKIAFLILVILVHFCLKIVVFIQFNGLYNQLSNVTAAIDKSGIYWLFYGEEILDNSEENDFFDNDETLDNVIAFTPWEQIEAINYYKDYVVLHCDERDYIFFVNDNSEKAVINTYFRQQQ